ncbi:hypothetical protein ABGB18_03555 [Nonomuraea sp. B12E4]|uniref:hypothetical protein n=1 Tax=Nonomuraea sp. B12E4 TaxID=3153564 RepID=UPI00325F5E84
MDAAVEADTAERAVDVRRVAGQHDVPGPERGGDPLVHVVDLEVDDRIAARVGCHRLELLLHPVRRGRRRRGLVRRHRIDRPPRLGRAQQEQPLGRIGDVVDVGQAGDERAQVDGGADDEEALGVGVAGELDAQGPAYRTGRAVRADQVAAAQLARAVRGLDGGGDAVRGAGHAGGPAAEQQLHAVVGAQPVVQHPYQVLLVELEPVREGRLAGQ